MILRFRLFWLAAGLSLIADLVSKSLVFNWLREVPRQKVELVDGFVWFTLHVNEGAVWGIGSGRQTFLLLVTALILPAVVAIAYTSRDPKTPLWSLGLLLGGAAGNLYDRAMVVEQLHYRPDPIQGVRDFIAIGWWPVFNIADVAIVAGVLWYLGWSLFFQKDPDEPSVAETDADPAAPLSDAPPEAAAPHSVVPSAIDPSFEPASQDAAPGHSAQIGNASITPPPPGTP